MSTSRNLFAGVAGSALTTLIGLAVVPFYLSHLGIEAYGVIGFFIATQALLQLADMGISPTLNREIARCKASDSMQEARTLFRTLEIVNWITAALVSIAIFGMAEIISTSWLQSRTIDRDTLTTSVKLMALVVAFRWPVTLYQSALIGMQRLDLASGIGVVMTALGSLGAVAVLANVSSTLEAFFTWQASIAVTYMIVMRHVARKCVGVSATDTFRLRSLYRIWRFSVGLIAITATALVLTQLDKILLSRLLTLTDFGHYMLATTIAGGFSVLLFTPTFNVVYPLFSSLVTRGDILNLERSYRLGTRVLGAVLFPLVMLVVLLSRDLVRIWTGNVEIANNVAPLLTLLSLGTALHGVMYFPYALQLASGTTKLPFIINILLLVAMVPLTIFLASTYGATGGALAWLCLNLIYLPLGALLTHRVLLRGLTTRWLFVDIGIPASLTLIAGIFGYALLRSANDYVSLRLGYGMGCAVVAALMCIAVFPDLQIELRRRVERAPKMGAH